MEIKADDGTSRKRTAEHEVWGQVLVGAEASILSFFFFMKFPEKLDEMEKMEKLH